MFDIHIMLQTYRAAYARSNHQTTRGDEYANSI